MVFCRDQHPACSMPPPNPLLPALCTTVTHTRAALAIIISHHPVKQDGS